MAQQSSRRSHRPQSHLNTFYARPHLFLPFLLLFNLLLSTLPLPISNATIRSGSAKGTIKPSRLTPNATSSLVAAYSSTAMYANWTHDCPCRLCGLSPVTGLRQIICDRPPLYHLPIYKIPPHIEYIEIRGQPPDRLNNLTLGPLFYRFPELKVLRVLHSNIPAIGQATFRYKTSLSVLDLSHNVIANLIDANFKGLRVLQYLNLSHNSLADLTSAPFRHLVSLRALNLSHNQIRIITTRLFYNLTTLETLDLSNNPFSEITPQNTLDLRPLRRLFMANCRLTELHSLFYRNVPNLEVLDLRHNHLRTLHKQEYRHLPHLNELYLDGNQLLTLPALAFYGNSFIRLGLSGNRLTSMHPEVFINTTITELDLSSNNFTTFDGNTFTPLASCLKILHLSNIRSLSEPSITVAKLIAPLAVLEQLTLSNLSLESTTLPLNIFSNHRQSLRVLNLSHNALIELRPKLVEGLEALQVLDLSYNGLFELDSDFLFALSGYPNLSYTYFDHNPWSCFRCHLLVFRNWISTTSSDRPTSNPYQNACQLKGRCAECLYPPQLEGVPVHELEEWQLEWCTDPTVQLRVSTTEPNVGLVLALLIIIILMIVIICVIIYYRNRGAIYFTNEDLLYSGRSPSTIPDGGGGGSSHHPWAMQSPPETEVDKSTTSTVFNVSSRIRQFVNATASPPTSGGHSIGSGSSSAESLERNNKSNGYVNGHEPIMKSISIASKHRDSTNTNESTRSTNGFKGGQTATILRRPKKQSSSVSTTSSKGPSTGRGVSYEEDMDAAADHGHYERPPSARYRILKPKSSSRSDDDDDEEEATNVLRPKVAVKRPVPPPLPPLAPKSAKPTTTKKKAVIVLTTSSSTPIKTRTASNATLSSSADSTADSEEPSKSGSDSEASGKHQHTHPDSLPSALRPYDEAARSSAEVEDVEEDEEEEEEVDDDQVSGASTPPTSQRRLQPRRIDVEPVDSSPDSSTQALAEGGSTSPSSTRSSEFTKSPLND